MMNRTDLRQFKKRLKIYGADLARWPEQEQEAARLFIMESPTARDIHAKTAALDASMDQFKTPVIQPALIERGVQRALHRRAQIAQSSGLDRRRLPNKVMIPTGALSLCALVLLTISIRNDAATNVNHFVRDMDSYASRTDRELHETDDMLSMLASDEPGDGGAQSAHPASDDMMHILFDDSADNGG